MVMARGRGPSKDPEQLRVQILRVPSLSLATPGACLLRLQYTTGIKVLKVDGGGIRVLLYGIAGGLVLSGVRLAGVVAGVVAQQGQSRVAAGQVPSSSPPPASQILSLMRIKKMGTIVGGREMRMRREK